MNNPRKSLTERMESHKGTPKSWIAEVAKLDRTIKEKDEKIDEYGDIIDVLATQREGLQKIIKNATIESAAEFIIVSLTHDEYKALEGSNV